MKITAEFAVPASAGILLETGGNRDYEPEPAAMPPPDSPPPRPEPAERVDLQKEQLRARQKMSVYFAMTLLILCAIALVTLPLNKVPFGFRAVAAAGDVVVAAILWVFVRQKLDGR